jgi:hypothetical protein
MLDEQEWDLVHQCLLQGPAAKREAALARYFEITGFRETNPNAIWHHRLSLFGPPCASCGKLLRTPRAKLCAACGAVVKRSA